VRGSVRNARRASHVRIHWTIRGNGAYLYLIETTCPLTAATTTIITTIPAWCFTRTTPATHLAFHSRSRMLCPIGYIGTTDGHIACILPLGIAADASADENQIITTLCNILFCSYYKNCLIFMLPTTAAAAFN